jgi:hypothetical protein
VAKSTSESIKILEEVYKMPGWPEEITKNHEKWQEVKHYISVTIKSFRLYLLARGPSWNVKSGV